MPRRPRPFRFILEEIESRLNPAPVTGTVHGTLLLNSGSLAVSGVPLTIAGTSTGGIAVNATATSNSTGMFEFDNVLPGTYTLTAGSAPGISGTSSPQSVTVPTGGDVTQNVTFTGGVGGGKISLRDYTNVPNTRTLTFPTGGTGTALAASRADSAPTVKNQIAPVTVATNAARTVIDLAGQFSDVDTTDSIVTFDVTNGGVPGTFDVQLSDTMAPQTVANFLDYVNAGDFTNALFTRNEPGFVLQGGGAKVSNDGTSITPTTVRTPVPNEFGQSNVKYTLAMALSGGDINSGTNQFFFNLGDNSASLDSQSFTVFGKVVDTDSQGVIDVLASDTTKDVSGTSVATANPTVLLSKLPLLNYTGTNFPTDATRNNYLVINGITIKKQDEALTYTATSSNTGLVTATVNGSKLLLDYVANQSGTSTITVTAKDKFGITTTQTFVVTVGSGNSSPVVAASIPDHTTVQGSAAQTVDLTGKFTDPDSDPLTFTAVSSDTSLVTVSVSGTTLTYQVAAAATGTAQITVTADDGHGHTVNQTFKVAVTASNSPPVVAAAIGNRTVAQGVVTSATVDLTDKFTDPDTGDTLTYTASSSDDAVVTVDVNGNNLVLTYTTTNTGTATVTVTATDTQNHSVSQTFTVTVNPDSPPVVAALIPNQSVIQGVTPTATVPLADKFTDPDVGDTLTYTATSSDDTVVTATVSGSNLTLGYSTTATGSATVTVTATDSQGKSVSQTFTVAVTANSPPTAATVIADQSVVQGVTSTATVPLGDKFTDPDAGDTLTYTAVSSDATVVTATVSGTNLTLGFSTTSTGTATVTVTATDTAGNTVSQTFNVAVTANSPPTAATVIANQSVVQGVTPTATVDLTDKFADPDAGDTLTYTATSSDDTVVTATVSGSNLTLGYSTTSTGTATVTVTATDTAGNTVSQTFTVDVTANSPPTAATVIANQSVVQGVTPTATVDLTDKFTDPDVGDTLTYTAVSSDTTVVTATVSGSTLTLGYSTTATGTATVTVTATDTAGNTVSQTFTVDVTANSPPTAAIAIGDRTVEAGTAAETVDLTDKFADPDTGDTLTYTATSSDTTIVGATVTGGQLTLTYDASNTGTATVTVTATDSAGNTATQTINVTLTAPNGPPVVAASIGDRNVPVDAPDETVSLADKFSDPDGDPLTYTATSSDGSIVVVTVSGDQLTFDFSATNAGTATVTVTAMDNHGHSVSQTLTVTLS